jgi:hypothetical protein
MLCVKDIDNLGKFLKNVETLITLKTIRIAGRALWWSSFTNSMIYDLASIFVPHMLGNVRQRICSDESFIQYTCSAIKDSYQLYFRGPRPEGVSLSYYQRILNYFRGPSPESKHDKYLRHVHPSSKKKNIPLHTTPTHMEQSYQWPVKEASDLGANPSDSVNKAMRLFQRGRFDIEHLLRCSGAVYENEHFIVLLNVDLLNFSLVHGDKTLVYDKRQNALFWIGRMKSTRNFSYAKWHEFLRRSSIDMRVYVVGVTPKGCCIAAFNGPRARNVSDVFEEICNLAPIRERYMKPFRKVKSFNFIHGVIHYVNPTHS